MEMMSEASTVNPASHEEEKLAASMAQIICSTTD